MSLKDKAKQRAYNIAYYAKNREKLRRESLIYEAENREERNAVKRLRYQQDPEKHCAQSRKYYADHREEEQRKDALYREENREKVNAKVRAYYARNAPAVLARNKTYRETFPERILAKNSRYRAQKRNAPINDLADAQWLEIKEAFDHRCAYCHKKQKRLTQDHVTPYARNGSNTLWNVVPACRSCNSKKGTRPPLKPVQPLLLTIAPSKKPKTLLEIVHQTDNVMGIIAP